MLSFIQFDARAMPVADDDCDCGYSDHEYVAARHALLPSAFRGGAASVGDVL